MSSLGKTRFKMFSVMTEVIPIASMETITKASFAFGFAAFGEIWFGADVSIPFVPPVDCTRGD
jgi:hypothetical protein